MASKAAVDREEQERQDKLHDDYLKHRGDLDRLRIEQLGSLDKALLTLSSSAIGFSIVLITMFARSHNPVGVVPLWLAWFFFVAAIVANLVSYWAAAKSIEIDMDNLDAEKRGEAISRVNRPRSWTFKLTGGALLSFIAGVVLLLIFAFQNAMAGSDTAIPPAKLSSGDGPAVAPIAGGSAENPSGGGGWAGGSVENPSDGAGLKLDPLVPGGATSPEQTGANGSKPPAARPVNPPPTITAPTDPAKQQK